MQRLAGDDRGAVSVIVGLLMVILLGFTALVVDVGATYADRRQLQNGADAAALSIAQDCAKKVIVCTAATAGAVKVAAETIGDANMDDASAVFTPAFPTSGSVKVTTTDVVQHYFAPILGIDSTTVHAQAMASWGSPGVGPAILPFTFAHCLFDAMPVNVEKWIIYKDNKVISTCDTDGPPGGFGWLDSDAGKCSAQIDIANPSMVGSSPGNSFETVCAATLLALKSRPAMLPIYDSVGGSGQNAVYRLQGFAAFQLTGWRFGANAASTFNDGSAATAPTKCTGDCRGVKGYFTKMVALDEYFASAGAADFGTSTFALTS